MAEYIERETVKSDLLSWSVCLNHPEHLLKEDALCVIDSIPAADVEPVKHGRWLNAVDEDPELYGWVLLDTVLCSACRKIDKENSRKTPRCPNCGAKMDKEDSDG